METQEVPPQGSPTQKDRLRSFPDSARLVAAFLGCRGSCLELAVLCSWSTRSQHPLGSWAGSRALGGSRGSSPGQPDSERPETSFFSILQPGQKGLYKKRHQKDFGSDLVASCIQLSEKTRSQMHLCPRKQSLPSPPLQLSYEFWEINQWVGSSFLNTGAVNPVSIP